MTNDPRIANAIVALAATYLLHSTLLIGAAWLTLACVRSRSALLHDRLWKLAALAPLLTAPLQFAAADHVAHWSVWTLPSVALHREGEAPAEPPPPKRSPIEPSIPRKADAPAEPLVDKVRPTSTLTNLDHETPVEIIPAPVATQDALDAQLPTIEPAPATTDETPHVVAIEPATIPEASPASPSHDDTTTQTPIDTPAPAPVIAPDTPARPAQASNDPVPGWRTALAAIFGLIALAGLLHIAWRTLTVRLKLRALQTVNDGALRDSLDRLLQQRGVRRPVRLATSKSESAIEPAAGGILRWTIIIPPGIEQRLSPAEQHALLAHELAHLVRRDPLWLWIGAALCTCLPFQPLNFLAVRRWRQAAEELCDDWALAGGVRPLTLAHCLTRVAEWRLAPMPLGLTSDVGKSRFARRIARLVTNDAPPDRWSRPARRRLLIAATLAAAALLACCGPRMQAGPTPEQPQSAIDSATTKKPDKSVADSDEWMPAAEPTAANEPPDDRENDFQPVETPGSANPKLNAALQTELAALLNDLDRVEQLIAKLGDDPELTTARQNLKSRLRALQSKLE